MVYGLISPHVNFYNIRIELREQKSALLQFNPPPPPPEKLQNKAGQKFFTRALHLRILVQICSPVHADTL